MAKQDELNEATEALGHCIKTLDRLSRAAGKEADALCKQGDNATSAKLRSIEGAIRMAAGMATEAYAKGRSLAMPSQEGEIVAFGGGK